MGNRVLKALLVSWLLVFLGGLEPGPRHGFAAGRVGLGSPTRGNLVYSLPASVAEENGIWKKHGINVDWLELRSGVDLSHAMVTGAVGIAFSRVASVVLYVSRGIPVLVVADLGAPVPWNVWVLADSPIKEPKGLQDSKVGVIRMGSLVHVYGRVIAKELSLEREMKFVALGGFREMVAGLKSGAVQAIVNSTSLMIPFELDGTVRRVATLPPSIGELDAAVLFATKRLIQGEPPLVEKAIKGTLEASDFMKKNPSLVMAKIKALLGSSEAVAREQYKLLNYSADGRINRNRLEEMRQFMIEHGLLARDKAPRLAEVYSPSFVPVD